MDVVSNSVTKANDSRDVVFTFYAQCGLDMLHRLGEGRAIRGAAASVYYREAPCLTTALAARRLVVRPAGSRLAAAAGRPDGHDGLLATGDGQQTTQAGSGVAAERSFTFCLDM